MFIAMLFTVAKAWKQPQCPSVMNEQKNVVYIHDGIALGLNKDGNSVICNNMDKTGGHFAKNKPDRER